MWACLQDHDTTGHWKQVAGWRKVCDLALAHLSRLQEYRRGLAAAWPPETNAAARAYIGELDQLIDQVQRTHDAAAGNHDALAAATRAIGSTRAELEPLYKEYATKLQQKQAYEATVADPKAVAGSRLPEQPPVTDADLERLNVQARGLMTGLSGELQQAQVMLRQPPPRPRINPQVDQTNADVYSGASAAPVIPPIVPIPVTATRPATTAGRPAASARQVTTPTAPGTGPVLGAGPVLGGAGAGLATPPVAPVTPAVTPPSPLQPGQTIGLPPLTGSSRDVGTAGPVRVQTGPIGRPSAGGASGLPHVAPPTPPRSMPPSGLIGGTPAMGLGQPGGTNPPRRVNPVGGVFGSGGAGTSPTGGAGSRPGAGRASQVCGLHGASPIGGAPGMGNTSGLGSAQPNRSQGGAGSESHRWNPDHPWETEEGVSPVVRPPDEEGPINPGPAIGFDR